MPDSEQTMRRSSSSRSERARRSVWVQMALVVVVVLFLLGFLWCFAVVQPFTIAIGGGTVVVRRNSLTPQGSHGHATSASTPVARSTPGVMPTSDSAAGIVQWFPSIYPDGWIQAGLDPSDAVYAERTALAFTDREEALDYRDVGTRTQHGGTLTAPTYVLSQGALIRFFQSDAREANNTLFDHVQSVQLIQAAINESPSLTNFQTQGNSQFATVVVSFQLFNLATDPATKLRTGIVEMDQGGQAFRTHHMQVLLVRQPPGTQGSNAAMGGTGWLVSNYLLDPPGDTSPPLLQPF